MNPLKIKLVELHLLIFVLTAYIIVKVEKHVDEMPTEKVEQMVYDYRAQYDTRVPEDILYRQISGNSLITIMKNVPKDILIRLGRQLTDEQYKFMLIMFSKMNMKEQHWTIQLFKHLNEHELRRLIFIVDRLGMERALILVERMMQLPITTQKEVISTLFRMPLGDITDLVYVMQEMAPDMIETMFTVLKDVRDISIYMDIISLLNIKSMDELFESIQKLPLEQRDIFVGLIIDLDEQIYDSIGILMKLDRHYLIKTIEMLTKLDTKDRKTFIKVFNRMSVEHIKRGLEIMEVDGRILKTGVDLTERLDRHLRNGEEVDTIERAINTASRVTKEKRYEGLIKVKEQRSVAIRRLFKQVDGNKDTYTGNIIENIVDDYDMVERKERFVDIITGSDGIIHGSHRVEPKVSQERKLFRIKETYSGNRTDKDEVLDFFDTKPFLVPHRIEDTFIIKPPQELEEKNGL